MNTICLLVCPIYTQLRRKFLPRFCWSFVNINKFKYIMCSNFERSILNLAKYIIYAFWYLNSGWWFDRTGIYSNSLKNRHQTCKLLQTVICYISIILYCIFSDYCVTLKWVALSLKLRAFSFLCKISIMLKF